MEIPNSHLFVATFHDDTQITQTEEDKSQTTEGKNAFYDVMQRLDELKCFVLIGKEHRYGVDLVDGHFEIDGVPFFNLAKLTEDRNLPLNGYRLIYYRDVSASVNVTSNKKGEVTEMNDAGYVLHYLLGWQGTDSKGANHQEIIKVLI